MKKSTKIFFGTFVSTIVIIGAFYFGKLSGLTEVSRVSNNGYSNKIDFNKVNYNVQSLFNKINKEYLNDFDTEKAEEGIYKGILKSLNDPYSAYYNEEEFKELNEHSSGEFGGVGIQVSATEGEYITVISPIKGTPGDKAGIKSGDRITHINGETVSSKDLEKAVKIMRGKPGTDVNLTILRGEGEGAKSLDMKITRALINVESVHAKMLDNNIGYIHLSGFQEKSAHEFIEAYKKLKSEGANKIILDLRNNPGGLLDVTMEIADFLLDKGIVINIRHRDGRTKTLDTVDGKDDLPLVTLINEGSASASEVLSGALQDHKRSRIVGKKSFGKGVIQNLYPINNNGKKEGMKLTIAEFYTPNNNKIHGVGIKPDYEVDIPEGVDKIGVENIEKDTQLQKAIELLNN